MTNKTSSPMTGERPGHSTPITIPLLRELDDTTKLSNEHKENINVGPRNEPAINSSPNQPLKALQPFQLTAPRSSCNRLLPRPHLRDSHSPATALPPLQQSKRNTPPSRGKWSGNNILRPGESLESFFGIDQASTDEYRQLCRSISNGIEDNAKTWHRVLQLASERAENDRSWFSNGAHLIRLHRRATSRLADATLDEAKLVSAIWLSYAQALARYGSEKDARMMFQYIQNQRLCESDSNLYVALSELEEKSGNDSEARASLQQGLEKEAQPLSILREALQKLDSKSTIRENAKEQITEQSPKKRRKLNADTTILDPLSLSFETKEVDSLAPKKDSLSFQLRLVPKSCKTFTSDDATPPKSNLQSRMQSTADPSESASSSGSKNSSQKAENEAPHHGSGVKSQCLRYNGIFSTVRSSRPPLLSKTPLPLKTPLISRGSLGKPVRVDPSTAFLANVDTDDEDCSLHHHKQKIETDTEKKEKTKASKITKMDLSYMWAWDPDKKPSKDGKIAEKTNEYLPSSVQEMDCLSGDSSDSGQQACDTSKAAKTTKSSDENQSKFKEEESKDKGQFNDEFLPLVKESNMIRVNGVPYAKLGVIGRGGSCKVYRALSTNCNVIAIKKVKLDGMDKKAIDGYSNEIALLKRLRGNPAIIQMFDSQVDLERKSILLTMELGEVDLNHVLQQQEIAMAAKRDHRQLNLNFVRLTWQQMLTAVHSIHEERIIHGDLKPANFLFVRGALKLIDFGIAKAIQSDDTTNIYRESQIGTLNYMSPEAILDTGSSSGRLQMKLGRASDIWSLGCILYQMVYGKTPFADLHMIQKLQAIINPNHKIAFPGDMDECAIDAIKKCLQRNAQDRPPIIGENGLLNHHKFLNG
ncbi:serine/threonine-protein kinase TTK/MPS1 [Fistulifera solaris]|uniref:Serine/threonine-protein kinase TTK/MPS1 n=1 Tax=Fistulifera solaris TaxID=1519565 RepID=A0A1Z5J741_FISSO|nr:serine/threonine-protein kinase TTK/MPS1 [Fistulifera solaris]|eukprot:GAX09790.1 serine/threonine-protein kinase TTK/MPS1 [Fistulifera solaris]